MGWEPPSHSSGRRVDGGLSYSCVETAGKLGRGFVRLWPRMGEVAGRVAGRGVKVERNPASARLRGIFAPVFYGLLADENGLCRLSGHFQIHPVGRLYIGAWILLSTLLALALLVAAAFRATPESSAGDALGLLLPVLLPFLGLVFASWQRRRGRADEEVMRAWFEAMRAGRVEDGGESAVSSDENSTRLTA